MTDHIVDFFLGIVVPTIKSPYMNFVSIGIGWLVHNRTSIDQDRRKEFNAIAVPLYKGLCKQIEQGGHWSGVQSDNWRVLEHYISWHRRACFRHCVADYQRLSQQNGEYDPITDQTTYPEGYVEHLLSSAKELKSYLKPR